MRTLFFFLGKITTFERVFIFRDPLRLPTTLAKNLGVVTPQTYHDWRLHVCPLLWL